MYWQLVWGFQTFKVARIPLVGNTIGYTIRYYSVISTHAMSANIQNVLHGKFENMSICFMNDEHFPASFHSISSHVSRSIPSRFSCLVFLRDSWMDKWALLGEFKIRKENIHAEKLHQLVMYVEILMHSCKLSF